jgi:hypothetical protein
MVGLIFFGVIIGYILLAVFITNVVVRIADRAGASKKKRMALSWTMILIFLLIPFWELIPTLVYHQHLCNTEAGVKIYRSVEGVEGFLVIGTGELTMAEKWGYKYIDMNLSEGIRRPRKNESGGLPLYFLESPSAPSIYGYKYEITRGLPWNAVKHTDTTYVIATGEVLGTFTDFEYTAADPNIPMSEWRKPWLSSRHGCFGDHGTQLSKEMVLKTLKPVS